ncbi:transposase family protein [Actinomadura napierensis]|uniref:Transposase family protein n=1 Tax=Actinomadura napierensis TaxID=267854 RepID=A0ABP5M6M2_9ACTN
MVVVAAGSLIVDHGRMVRSVARAAVVGNRRITGLSPAVIDELVAEVGPVWQEWHQAVLAARPRRRAVGAGAKYKLVFVDRLPATLIHLRYGVTHDVLGCWLGVSRSTITRAIAEIRPLLAARGRTVEPGIRLCTLAEVIEYLGANGQTAIIDATEVRVLRPAAKQPDCNVFVSGKNKQNAIEAMVVTHADGHLLFCGQAEPGTCADITQARRSRLVELLAAGPPVQILADVGYQGLGAETAGQVVTPPYRKFRKNAPAWYEELHAAQCHTHSVGRIRVEHSIAHLKNWRSLARHHGRREHLADMARAAAALLSLQQATPHPAERQA